MMRIISTESILNLNGRVFFVAIISCLMISACTQPSTPADGQLKCIPTSMANCTVSTAECNAIPITDLGGFVYLILNPGKSQVSSYKDEQFFDSSHIDYWESVNGSTFAGGHGASGKQEARVWSATIDETEQMSLSILTLTGSYLLTASCESYEP